jgi:hypothetical protein
MTDSDLKRYNRILAEDLGRAPNGQALYKWIRTRDLFYLVEDAVDIITPAGLYATTDNYHKVTWEQRLGAEYPWIVATWQDPGTPGAWFAKYGKVLPYPPQGMYFPLEGSQIPCDPTEDISHEVVAKVKSQLSMSFDETLSRMLTEADKQDAKQRSDSDDHIDSDWPAFNCEVVVPGYTPEKDTAIKI